MSPVGNRKILTLLCFLAFTVVFAHSVVPHEHHCSRPEESHIHHFGNCEQLGTYLHDEDSVCAAAGPDLLFLPSGCTPETAPEDTGTGIVFAYGEIRLPDRPETGWIALRAPPCGRIS